MCRLGKGHLMTIKNKISGYRKIQTHYQQHLLHIVRQIGVTIVGLYIEA